MLSWFLVYNMKESAICSVQFISVVSDSLRPHGLKHSRPPCPSPTPGVYSNSCPLSQWYYPTISSSIIHFFCLQSFPASGSFQMSQFFASGGQNSGVSASASVLPMNIQNWFPLGWTGNQCSHGWRKLVGYSPFHHDCQLLFFSATVELKLKRLD